MQHLLDLNSVGLKVQHQNGCEGVLGTWPPLLSHLAKSNQGFQVYIYARYALLLYENMQVCNMWHFCVCTPSSKLVHSRRLDVLLCTGVTSWVVINKFHLVKNDPTNIHVLEFGPSYDVRNGAEKAVTVPCYRFDCTWIWGCQRDVGTTSSYFVWPTKPKAHKSHICCVATAHPLNEICKVSLVLGTKRQHQCHWHYVPS